MHKVVSARAFPTILMDSTSKKCKKRGRRALSKRGKRKVAHKIDHISDLPDHVLHIILSYLHRKDAARTCILSKRWRQVWNSYQVLDFDLLRVHNLSRASVELYRKQIYELPVIHKFKLCFARGSGLSIDHATNWIDAAIERNVRELEIQVKGVDFYYMPTHVLRGSSITALSLYGCNLFFINSISLPKLQKLSLKSLDVTSQLLQAIFSDCPLIEDFRLIQCSGFDTVSICNLDRLKRVDLHKCRLLDHIVIEAQSLESFWYYNDKKKLCDINIEACRALKQLIMEYPRWTDEVFHDQIMVFPELERLVLSRCNGLKRIRLTGDKLKNLVIRRCRNLLHALIDTPNLTSLEYIGQKMPLSFSTRISLKKALLYFGPFSTVAAKLKSFLDSIDCDKRLKFMSLNKLGTVIYEDIRGMFVPVCHITKPREVRISMCLQDLLDAAFKTSPFPTTFSVMSHFNSDFPKIIQKELKRAKSAPQCCGYFKNKCWRHYLKNVSVESWVFDPRDSSKPSASLACWESTVWENTGFTLTWNQ